MKLPDFSAFFTKTRKKWRVYKHRHLKTHFILGLKIAGISFVAGLALLAFLFFIFSFNLPSATELKDAGFAESTKILDRNGDLIYEYHGDEKRTFVKREDISPYIINAVLSLEDDEFYSHPGFDWKGIARSSKCMIQRTARIILRFIPNCVPTGGSTITQQFVKNTYLSNERTLKRKIKELILARRVENTYTKDEILELYLNRISFGGSIYGIETASLYYFGIHSKDVSLAQAATLASMIAKPTKYSPYLGDRARLQVRAEYAITRMKKLGYINDEELNISESELKQVGVKNEEGKDYFQKFQEAMNAPHFVVFARQELQNLLEENFSEERAISLIETGGLTVTTTLDLKLQAIAEDVITKNMEKNEKNKVDAENAALVAEDPRTGEILSMVGSKNFSSKDFDGQVNVATSLRQPGSSIKPLVYMESFLKGYSPGTVVYDVLTNFGGKYIPRNYDGRVKGPVTLRSALAQSLNIPAVKALYLAGIEDSIALGQKLGLSSWKENDADRCGLSLVLGGCEVRLIDMVHMYSTFANLGKQAEQHIFLKVVDRNGEVIYEHNTPTLEEKIDPRVAYLTHSILSDNASRAPVFGINNLLQLPRENGAKTGTTNEYKDAWTLGYVPQLVAGVWVGNNIPSSMKNGGAMVAAPIWNQFMNQSLKLDDYKEVIPFTRPEGIVSVATSTLTGKIPSANTPPERIRSDLYLSENAPKEVESEDQIKKFTICKNTNLLATEFCPRELQEILIYEEHKEVIDHAGWQAAIDAWVKKSHEAQIAKQNTPPAEGESEETENITADGIPFRFIYDLSEAPQEYDTTFSAENIENAPQISWKETPSATLEYGSLKLEWEIVGKSKLTNSSLSIDNVLVETFELNQRSESAQFTLELTEEAYALNSEHTISIEAIDSDERKRTISQSFKITDDASPPKIKFFSPRAYQGFSSGEIHIIAEITDSHAIKTVEFYLNGTPLGKINPISDNNLYSYDIKEEDYPPAGSAIIAIRAYDEYDNSSKIEREISIR